MASQFGDLDNRTAGNAFAFDLNNMLPFNDIYGMSLIDEALYGFLSNKDGKTFAVFLKIVGPLIGGTHLMRQLENGLEVDPVTFRTARGEVIRTITPTHRKWADPLIQRLPAAPGERDDIPFLLQLDNEGMTWEEGDFLKVKGRVEPLGIQYAAFSLTDPLFNTTNMYRVSGTIFEEEVSGVIFMDRVHGRAGLDWKDSEKYSSTNLGWHTFANIFEDGTAEYGVIVNGAAGFNSGIVIDAGACRVSTPFPKTSFEFAADDYLKSATAELGGERWHFARAPGGEMRSYSNARWANYHAQLGATRREGDLRTVVHSFAWYESFRDRITAAGLAI